MNYREAWANGEIEAGTLVDRIEEQAREIERLNAVGLANEKLTQRIKELKAQPSGVVLPERKAQRITDAYAAGFNACLDEVARLNQPASAGDERAAFVRWITNSHGDVFDQAIAEHYWEKEHVSALSWQARAALSANHSEQVADGLPAALFNALEVYKAKADIFEGRDRAIHSQQCEMIRQHAAQLLYAAPSAGTQGGDV